MSDLRLVLASQSPRRRELLALLGLPFEAIAPAVVEAPEADESPPALTVRLSLAKAQATRADTLIVACDTVVALDGEPLGKPQDAAEATDMLRRLRGRPHAVYSGIALLDSATSRTLTDLAETRVMMRAYADAEIAEYVVSGDPLDKAGAYAIQHAGFHPVAELQGCYTNVMGFPLCHFGRCLRTWGIELPCDVPTACQAHTARQCTAHHKICTGQPDSSPL
jgi:septum formation protein